MDTTKVAEIVLKVNGDDVNRKMKELQARLGKAREKTMVRLVVGNIRKRAQEQNGRDARRGIQPDVR